MFFLDWLSIKLECSCIQKSFIMLQILFGILHISIYDTQEFGQALLRYIMYAFGQNWSASGLRWKKWIAQNNKMYYSSLIRFDQKDFFIQAKYFLSHVTTLPDQYWLEFVRRGPVKYFSYMRLLPNVVLPISRDHTFLLILTRLHICKRNFFDWCFPPNIF